MITNPEPGKWYNENWQGPDLLVEYSDGSIRCLSLKEANLDCYDPGKPNNIKRWCLCPTDSEPKRRRDDN